MITLERLRQVVEDNIRTHQLDAEVVGLSNRGVLVKCAGWNVNTKEPVTLRDEIRSIAGLRLWLGY